MIFNQTRICFFRIIVRLKQNITYLLTYLLLTYLHQSVAALREESSQTNAILQYKLLAAIVSAVCSVIQQS